jgi:hypothetical protein
MEVAREVVLATEEAVKKTRMAALGKSEGCWVFIEPVVDYKIRLKNSGSENIFHCCHSETGLQTVPHGG